MRSMFIVGSDAFLLTSMRVALQYSSGVNVLGVREEAEASLARAIREAEPDIVVIDASGYPDRALDRLRAVREERPRALVVVIATQLDVDLFEEAAEQGALACLGTATLVPLLQALLTEPPQRNGASGHIAIAAANGAPSVEIVDRPAPVEPECPLTQRQLEILRAVAEGHTNARIGRELWVTEETVKFHLSKIYRKLGVANRTEASRYALLNDLVATRRPVRRRRPAQHSNGNGHRVLAGAQR